MNKEEVIEAIKKISDDLLEVRFVSLESVIDIVSQIHEPQKVVVPKFVAEWIKKNRHAHTLLRVLNAVEKGIDITRPASAICIVRRRGWVVVRYS